MAIGDAETALSDDPGVEIAVLHDVPGETVRVEHYAAGAVALPRDLPGGGEYLVLDGTFEDEAGTYPQGSWLRLPPHAVHQPRSTAGCVVWSKTGHLADLV
ncbi:MAG: cupin domain-containing protein [Pseudomonadota bacterium]